MGVMIIPYVSSLSDDVMTAVPLSLRDGSLALGAANGLFNIDGTSDLSRTKSFVGSGSIPAPGGAAESVSNVEVSFVLFDIGGAGKISLAPAWDGVQMAEAYLKDEKKLLPCAVNLNGEYNVSDIYAGVPVIIGKEGVEKIEEIELDDNEKKEFLNSIEAVRKLWDVASKIDTDLSK